MTKRKRRAFDESFKRMAVELSEAKGSVAEAAAELGLDAGHIGKWRASFSNLILKKRSRGTIEREDIHLWDT